MLRNPGVSRVMASQLLARFAFGMMSLGFVIAIQRSYHSYTLAGIALGAETVGAAIAGPILAREIAKRGVRKLIGTSTLVTSALLLLLALVPLSPVLVVLAGLGIGLSSPPIQASVRSIYPHLVPKNQQHRLFSLDATLQELIWIFGPVLATAIAAAVYPNATLIAMSVIQVLGSAVFLANPEVARFKPEPTGTRLGGVLKNPVVLGLMISSGLLIGSFSGVEVGTVGILSTATAGWVLSVFSIGSLVGGFVIGPRAKSAKWMVWFNLLILCGYLLALLFSQNPWWLALCWFVAGMGIAPALGLNSTLVSLALKKDEAGEAYGWIMTGQLVGYSIGAAIAGFVIDAVAGSAAIWVAVVFQIATIVATLVWLPSMPKMHAGDNTQSIPVLPDHH